MNLQAYWRKIRQIESSLKESHPDGVHLATVANDDTRMPAGVISVVLHENAARLLVTGSHRIAEPEEVERFQAEQRRRGELIGAQTRRLERENRESRGISYDV